MVRSVCSQKSRNGQNLYTLGVRSQQSELDQAVESWGSESPEDFPPPHPNLSESHAAHRSVSKKVKIL